MAKRKKYAVNCAECMTRVCRTEKYMDGPQNCPTRLEPELVTEVKKAYKNQSLSRFARIASLVEGLAYGRVPWSDAPSPQTTRLEEIIRFAKKLNYKKLGLAFCVGLAEEAAALVAILKGAGFEVISVCCKAGGIAKEEIGIKDPEKINPGKYESMCNPILQAEILNRESCDFNIMLGLCVGHDSLFLKHVHAMTTVFAVKDRLLGHNPLAAIYLSRSYYRRLRLPELGSKLAKE